jgi:ubiquinone/menaquinone biosynthesis C-methylase UbiE
MGSAESGYQLGSDAAELKRLDLQGRVLALVTRTILQMVGVRRDMRFLDLGSGAGDVAFVAAELAGPGGEVVGIDQSPDSVAKAAARAAERGLSNVRFVVGDIHDRAPDGPFDAITGRLVVMYLPDPAAVLRTQAGVLRFATGLRDAVDLDTVRADLLAVANRAVEPKHISVWITTSRPGPLT